MLDYRADAPTPANAVPPRGAPVGSTRLLFYATLMLMMSFTFSFARDVGLVSALPWVIATWLAWGLGVAWVRSRGGRRGRPERGAHDEKWR